MDGEEINVNISDKFYDAIAEYNQSVLRNPDFFSKQSKEYLRGMVFTSLRRCLPLFSKKRSYNFSPEIRAEQLKCTFHSNGTVNTIVIDKQYKYNEAWFDDGTDKNQLLVTLKNITGLNRPIYPTKALNDLASIFNRL